MHGRPPPPLGRRFGHHRGAGIKSPGHLHPFDDSRWGSVTPIAILAGGTPIHPVPLEGVNTGGHIVDLDLWPPRVVSVLLVLTPTTLPAWIADGQTYEMAWTIGVGIGSTQEKLIIKAPFAPPYDQLVLPAAGEAFPIPVKRLTIDGALTGLTQTTGQLGARMFAAAAPWSLAGLGVEYHDEENQP